MTAERDRLIALAEKCGAEVGRYEGEVVWIKLHQPVIGPLATALSQDHGAARVRAEAMEEAAQACDDVEERPWYGYENPNTFQDAKWACAAAIRSLINKG